MPSSRCTGNTHIAATIRARIRSPPPRRRHTTWAFRNIRISRRNWTRSLRGGFRTIPDTPHKTRGIAVGRQSAAAILALRVNDGWDYQGTYTFSNEPGAYQTTPPWNGFVLQPGFRYAKPFGLRSPDQFRPGPPPRLDSPQYAAAFNEVKDFGRVDSVVRTPDQTLYAVWWLEFAETSVNRLARQLATQRRTHLWQASRMFALLNMSLYDGYIAILDSKYEYNHWRPYTAIRQAALDGNPATAADPNWEPLRTTPPFPEYVSGHATATAATMDILARTFGDNVSFTMATTTAPPEMPTRSFRSFSAAAAECADSRVRVGFHFRYATDRGLTLGRAVADGWTKTSLRSAGVFAIELLLAARTGRCRSPASRTMTRRVSPSTGCSTAARR